MLNNVAKCVLHAIFIALISIVFLNNNASASTYSASLTTSGNINLDIHTGGNSANIAIDNLTVTSTCPNGYSLSISGPNDTTLYKDGDNSSSDTINASSGTIAAPTSILGQNQGTWGYSLQSSNVTGTFIGLTNEEVIISTSNSATPSTGTNIPVYYGVSITNNTKPGIYKMAETTTGANDNVITYYLTTPITCTSYQIVFDPSSIVDGETITGTGTMPNQIMPENLMTDLQSNQYIAPEGYYFMGWNTSQDGSGTWLRNNEVVSDLAPVGNTIILYAQWTDCPPEHICYKDNGADSTTTIANELINVQGTTTLIAPNYWRQGYGFAGWSVTADGDGAAPFGPNEAIDTREEFNFYRQEAMHDYGFTLYAKWIESSGTMQQWGQCGALQINDVIALSDARDNKTYAVAKLADGKCWMIENLRLDNTASNNSNGSLAQGYANGFYGLANPEYDNFNSNTIPNSIYNGGNISGPYNDVRYTRSNNSNTSTPAQDGDQNSQLYSYGNYYTWPAAIASTANYQNEGQWVQNTSICPRGWRLPTGGKNYGDYYYLAIPSMGGSQPQQVYDSNENGYIYKYEANIRHMDRNASQILRSYPNNFTLSGWYMDNSTQNLGTSATYWSSISASLTGVYTLYIDHDNVMPGTKTYNLKSHGFTVRCLIE